MTSSPPSDPFAHAEFWNGYSRRWDETVRPHIDGDILGEEWAPPDHTRYVFERFAAPYLRPDARVVEIGPGGGKFSRLLIERCRELVLVDISREMLARANRACGGRAREVLVEDGRLAALETAGVDLVFSYDVFIHLESEEVLRYLAEVNRVLRQGGIFSIHTSNFESRWGLHSYLQQLGHGMHRIGSRYGGRMYPLTPTILRRLAEHSGFAVADRHANPKDKDILYALRKARPARLWTFLTSPELHGRFELCERFGGSDRHELVAALEVETGDKVVLALGDSADPALAAIGHAQVPDHPCLAAPAGWHEHGSIGIVRFPLACGRGLSQQPSQDSRPPAAAAFGKLLEGLLAAHAAGLTHGNLGPELIAETEDGTGLLLFGLAAPEPADAADLRARDIAAVGPMLEAAAGRGDAPAGLAAAAGELASHPGAATLARITATLLAS